MYLLIKYTRNIELANKTLKGWLLAAWKAKSKVLMGSIRATYGKGTIDIDNGFLVAADGSADECRKGKEKLDKKLYSDITNSDIKGIVTNSIFRKVRAKFYEFSRLKDKTYMSILMECGILLEYKISEVNKW